MRHLWIEYQAIFQVLERLTVRLKVVLMDRAKQPPLCLSRHGSGLQFRMNSLR
jgi:hypothetical protein